MEQLETSRCDMFDKFLVVKNVTRESRFWGDPALDCGWVIRQLIAMPALPLPKNVASFCPDPVSPILRQQTSMQCTPAETYNLVEACGHCGVGCYQASESMLLTDMLTPVGQDSRIVFPLTDWFMDPRLYGIHAPESQLVFFR